MSELVVAGFADTHRAAQVVNEIERLEQDWVADFDHAAVVARDKAGKGQVILRIGLDSRQGVGWARLWTALLRDALALPFTEEMTAAPLSAQWWWDEFGIDLGFVRDVGALVHPGSSAIIVLLSADVGDQARRRLRNLGATLVSIALTGEQCEKIQNVLMGQTS